VEVEVAVRNGPGPTSAVAVRTRRLRSPVRVGARVSHGGVGL